MTHPDQEARAAFEALKPCPCCGGEPELRYQGNDFTRSRKLTVRCKSCRLELTHAAMRHDFAWLESHILADWNRRQPAGAEVPVPVNADQAALMCLLGEAWLREHAPERLRNVRAEVMEECARLVASMTERRRRDIAERNKAPIEPCEMAAVIRLRIDRSAPKEIPV